MRQSDPDRKLRALGWWLHGLGVLVALAIAWLSHLLVCRPLGARTAACLEQTAELETVIRREAPIRAERARLREDLAAARQQAVLLRTRIPDKPQEADFLADVSRLAHEVGLQIQDYRPGVPVSGPSYAVLQVDLICSGSYRSICSFLDQLSKLPRYSTMARLQIDADGKSPEYSAKISVILYYGVRESPSAGKKEPTDA